MTVTALHSRTGIPLVGGYGPAMAAKEALTRDLSVELAPHGIRERIVSGNPGQRSLPPDAPREIRIAIGSTSPVVNAA